MLYSNVSGEIVFPSSYFAPAQQKTICISGHREKSIYPFRNNPENTELTAMTVRLLLERYLEMAINSGYTSFINGLAVGTDLWAADYIIRKKLTNPDIKLIGVMPYLRHAECFPKKYLEILKRVEADADYLLTTNTDRDITYRKTGKASTLYRDRNYYMVDNSSALIAFLDEKNPRSGTGQTVNYAACKGKKIYRFGMKEVFEIMDNAGTDIEEIERHISLLPNIFV